MTEIADELVKVEKFPGVPLDKLIWAIRYGVGDLAGCLCYEGDRASAEELADSLKALVNEGLNRYKHPESGEASVPMTAGSVGPDLFAGSLRSMSAILGEVAGLLGLHSMKVIGIMTAARDLCLEIENLPGVSTGAPLSSTQTRDLLQKSSALRDTIEDLSKEW